MEDACLQWANSMVSARASLQVAATEGLGLQAVGEWWSTHSQPTETTVTHFNNPPNQPPIGEPDWTSCPARKAEADNAWRDDLAAPELGFVEAVDELRETWQEASDEADRDLERTLARWPEPAWWHTAASWVLSLSGIAAAVLGTAALAGQSNPVPVTTDSVVSTLLAVLIPLGLGASSLLRTRRPGLGHTSLRWRAFELGAAVVLPMATIAMMREDWATPALWAFLPLAAALLGAAVTGWRFSRPSER